MTQEQRNKKAEQLRLAAQIVETGCGWDVKLCSGWFPNGHIETAQWGCPLDAINSGLEIRILPSVQFKEPVIPVPEGWRELRDDEKDGSFIRGAKYLYLGEWKSLTSGSYACEYQRIIVPVARPRVPLEPCDIPPGTCIKPSDEYVGWGMICEMDSSGVHLGESRHLSFKNLMDNNWSIKRPTDTEWQPCSKPAP